VATDIHLDQTCTKVTVVADDRNEESINGEDDIEWEATVDTYEDFHRILMH